MRSVLQVAQCPIRQHASQAQHSSCLHLHTPVSELGKRERPLSG